MLPPATISDILTGKSAPKLDFVTAFVRACLSCADHDRVRIQPSGRNLLTWQSAWQAMQQALDAAADGDTNPTRAELLVPHQLPPPPRMMVGRSQELQILTKQLATADEDAPLVITLDGPGGFGKTAIALAWASRHRGAFPHGQLFADLRGYGSSEPLCADVVMASFLVSLGFAPAQIPASSDDLVAAYRTAIYSRRLLVVLDNAASEAQVRPFLPPTLSSKLIVTSRPRLAGLEVRDGAERIPVGELHSIESLALLRRLAPHLSEASDFSVQALAKACGNVPLALRLAAHRLSGDVSEESLARLVSGTTGQLIEALDGAVGEASSRMSTVLSWSMAALPPESLRAFLLLAGHAGRDFGSAAGAAIVGVSMSEFTATVSVLLNQRLLNQFGDRYSLHDVVRSWATHAAENEIDEAGRCNAKDRELAFYLMTADAADRVLSPYRGRPEVAVEISLPFRASVFGSRELARLWFDDELGNLVVATKEAAARGDVRTAARLPFVALAYLNLAKPWTVWIEMYKHGIDAADRGGLTLELADLRLGLGIARREIGDLDRAYEDFVRARTAYRAVGAHSAEAMTLVNLSNVERTRGQYSAALDHLRASQFLLQSSIEPWRLAVVLHNLAEILLELTRFDEAAAQATEAARLAESLDDLAGVGLALTTLADVQQRQGRLGAAERNYLRALQLQQAEHDQFAEATTRERLGGLLLEKGDCAAGSTHLRAAAEILSQLGVRTGKEMPPLKPTAD